MHNIINEVPSEKLTNRLNTSVNFVSKTDIENKRILDIGCGYGWFELFAIKNNVSEICAIEITEKDLETIRKNVVNPKVQIKTGSAIEIPYPDGFFDTVVSWEVIEHIPFNTESQMFKEVSRVLKPGGKFYLSTPHSSLFSNVLDIAWWFGHRHYTFNQLKDFGIAQKLDIVEFFVTGSWWSVFDILNMYISKWIFRRPRFMKDLFDKNVEREYTEKNGFVNIFVKYERKN